MNAPLQFSKIKKDFVKCINMYRVRAIHFEKEDLQIVKTTQKRTFPRFNMINLFRCLRNLFYDEDIRNESANYIKIVHKKMLLPHLYSRELFILIEARIVHCNTYFSFWRLQYLSTMSRELLSWIFKPWSVSVYRSKRKTVPKAKSRKMQSTLANAYNSVFRV